MSLNMFGRNSKTESLLERKDKHVSRAHKILRKALREDAELYYGYQANIAMAFQDAIYYYKKASDKKYLNRKDYHTVSNTAAKNFLNQLTKE